MLVIRNSLYTTTVEIRKLKVKVILKIEHTVTNATYNNDGEYKVIIQNILYLSDDKPTKDEIYSTIMEYFENYKSNFIAVSVKEFSI